MKPSKIHNNRNSHNWLVYKIGDSFLSKNSKYIKGIIYDLGCGEKPYQDYFETLGEKYLGVDWSNTLHNLKADIVADLNKKLPIESDVADTIISFSVMEHLYEPQIMLNEAHRILKQGSHIILQVPFMWHVHEAPYDFYRYTEFGLKYMFEKAGFKIISIEPTSGFWTTWFLKLNYQLIRLQRGPRLIRVMVRILLKPVLYLNQYLAYFFDKIWGESFKETQGYYVVAKK